MPDVIDVVENIYTLDLPPQEWLRRVVASARPYLDQGHGVDGYFADVSAPDRVDGWGFVDADGPSARAQAFAAWRAVTPLWFQKAIHQVFPCGFSRDLPPDIYGEAGELARRAVITGNAFGVNGLDASGRGCVLVGWVPPGGEPRQRPDPALWARIAAHLATGVRLLGRTQSAPPAPERAEAVLNPTGQVADASGPARTRLALAALRDMAVRVEQARSRTRRDPLEATRLWQALVHGRWSLVDHFERSGRRYLLAIANEPEARPHTVLSRRERQVVGYAAPGPVDKLIAYETGLRPSTVATLLSRAARKFGVKSRVELVRRWLAEPLGEPGDPP
jgi:DNA-binding CsgD family transcriptional regulator